MIVKVFEFIIWWSRFSKVLLFVFCFIWIKCFGVFIVSFTVKAGDIVDCWSSFGTFEFVFYSSYLGFSDEFLQ